MTPPPDTTTPSQAPGRPHARRAIECVVVVLALMLHGVLALSATARQSIAFDELPHIAGGMSYWDTGDFRLQPENGYLPQRLAGLGAKAAGARFDWTHAPEWRESDVWGLGDRMLFDAGNDPQRVAMGARSVMIFVSVTLCMAIYLWSRKLFGVRGAMVSLAIATLCPNLLANGPLAVSDTTASLFFLATMAATAWLMAHVTWVRVVTLAMACAGLALSKMSAPLVVPMIALVLGVRVLSGSPLSVAGLASPIASRARQLGVLVAALLLSAALATVLVWGAYGFRYAAFSPGTTGQMQPSWDVVEKTDSSIIRVVLRLREHRVLPEPLLFGYAHVARRSAACKAFFFGDWGTRGWREFFPVALLIKTPLPTLLLMLLALAPVLRLAAARFRSMRNPGGANNEPSPPAQTIAAAAPLVALLLVYWATAIPSHMNIGFRHILPTLPAFYILAGAAAVWLDHRFQRAASAVILGLLLWLAAESFTIRPHYLSYFNQTVGGPANGYKCLADSSIDWGQDLPALADWLKQHAPQGPDRPPVYLAYFGTARPETYGVHATRILSFNLPELPRTPMQTFTAGIYCFSVTELQGVYFPLGTRWTQWHEVRYQSLVSLMRDLAAPDPAVASAARERLRREHGPDGQLAALRFGELRVARLRAFLRQREPDARAGYSIHIYHLTADDVRLALQGPPAELLPRTTAPGP